MAKPHPLFNVWSPDSVAECIDGIVAANLYEVLWNLIDSGPTMELTDCGDNFADLALGNKVYWDKLSEEDQIKLNDLAIKHEADKEKDYQEYLARKWGEEQGLSPY